MTEERFALARERVEEICREKGADACAPFDRYFADTAAQVCLFADEYIFIRDGGLQRADLETLKAHNRALYADIFPDSYVRSYANPVYAVSELGTEYGRLLSAAVYELRAMIPFAYEQNALELTIRMELFIELYTAFSVENSQYLAAEKEGRNPQAEGLTMIPPVRSVREILYGFVSDYAEDEMARDREQNLVGRDDYLLSVTMQADLQDLRYLYATGEYIGDNEIRTAQYMNSLPQEKIALMADTFTEGFRKGFEVTGKNLGAKKRISLISHIGFERMMRRAAENFAAMGKTCLMPRERLSLFCLKAGSGTEGGDPNPQYRYDHREDLALILDDVLMNRMLEALSAGYREEAEEIRQFAGPAVLETFGEKPFVPASDPALPHYDDVQQKLIARYRTKAGRLYNEAVIGRNRSFTIISFPLPEIGGRGIHTPYCVIEDPQKAYGEIFDAVIRINTLDYAQYAKIQETIIDTLNEADTLHVAGRAGNKTDLTVNLWKLKDPAHQTIFENCVADVNIPVGEVFTTPVLKGTNGTLFVSFVYLEGIFFKNLSLTFKDGLVTDYACGNFAGEPDAEEKGRRLIEENILFHHQTLPMGECAIGTNTTAYAAGRYYGITDRLPILIAEKTGPHFAVGDTCYSDDEENTVFNPDGKEIVAKENDFSRKRFEDPEKAYFGCHTDITIPYEELGRIEAVRSDGSSVTIIEDGRFVLPGTEALNEPLDRLTGAASAKKA